MSVSKSTISVPSHSAYSVLSLLALAFAFIAIGIGLRDPWPADEPRFAQVAREMVESGQWLFPIRGGELYPDKPPIFMWLIACVYWLTDNMRVAFLLPSAIAGTVSVWAVYDIVRRMWNTRTAWLAALLVLTTVQFVVQAKKAQIDATVCMWITLGCYSLLRALLLPHESATREKLSQFSLNKNDTTALLWWLAACVFMALGIMTKGVGFLPLLMLVPYAVLCRSNNTTLPLQRFSWWVWPLGIATLFGTLLLWLGPMLLTVDGMQDPAYQAYRDNIMMKQTVTRYANPWHHIKPFWYYLTSVVPWAWLPIVFFIPWLVKPLLNAWREHEPRVLLPLGFVLLLLVFFSASPGKRGVYILPAIPMLVVAIAPFLDEMLKRLTVRRIIQGLVALVTLAFFVISVLGYLNKGPLEKLDTAHELQLANLGMMLAVLSLLGLWLTRARHALWIWGIFSATLWVTISSWGYTQLNPIRTPEAVTAKVAELIVPNSTVALIGTGEQFMLFTEYPIVHFGYHTPLEIEGASAWQWMTEAHNSKPSGLASEQGKRYALMAMEDEVPCFDMTKVVHLGFAHRRDWVLADDSARLPECELPEQPATRFSYSPQRYLTKAAQ